LKRRLTRWTIRVAIAFSLVSAYYFVWDNFKINIVLGVILVVAMEALTQILDRIIFGAKLPRS
jgi:hypothetical protein